jgi:hypothetical protein
MRAALCLVLLAACKPDLGAPQSLVEESRVLAVKGEPAEGKPGDTISYSLLVAGPNGRETDPQATWAFCTAPKPLTENNAVASACLGDGAIAPIGGPAASIMAATPSDACSRFGPDPPPQQPGLPPLRPRDPDVTGGFYQPVRVVVAGVHDDAFALQRVKCNLGNAPIDIAMAYQMRYQLNANPTLANVMIPATVPPGAQVAVHAGWTPDSAETYPVFDLRAQALVDHREAMRVSWFATAGKFEHDRTGRDEAETETTTDNLWTAPLQVGVVHFWVVLRDSRGGVDFASYDVTVGNP